MSPRTGAYKITCTKKYLSIFSCPQEHFRLGVLPAAARLRHHAHHRHRLPYQLRGATAYPDHGIHYYSHLDPAAEEREGFRISRLVCG